MTEFTRGHMPVLYLSIPLAAQRLSVTDYSPLVDQIAGCIRKWTAKSLSFAGRLELIRSVLQGVECFSLQVFPLPIAVIEKIHRLCRAFLWNSKRSPVAWEDVCHPKEECGLGVRHIQSWNVALLARVLWNIHCKADTLWAKWVNEVYLRGASLWDWQPKKDDSPLLRRLAEIRDRIITDFGSTEAAIRHMTEWTDRKGLVTSKAYEYFRPKLPKQHWKASIWKAFIPPKILIHSMAWTTGGWQHETDLHSYMRTQPAPYALIVRNRPNIFSLKAPSVPMFGRISDSGLASPNECQPFSVQ
ncbi:hypothetical protein Sango_2977300 [Sesamum angolense]|uniref:Uncharacterized protein n=1 Tax=Sesamum angolense TaxID=2727404 RepID=A0AAE1T2G7_9LAMI|nr:hypothetical protein Sango_2977300 [Sesamum angolense]